MTTYNPAEAERLEREAREIACDVQGHSLAAQSCMRAMADQLEAARAEIERLESECDTLDRAREQPRAIASALSEQLRARDATKLRIAARLGLGAHATQDEIAEAVDAVVAERDGMRAIVEAVAGADHDQTIGSVKVYTVGERVTAQYLPVAASEAVRKR